MKAIKTLIIILLVIFFYKPLFCQLELLWGRNPYFGHRYIEDVFPTKDGGVLIMGYYDIEDRPKPYQPLTKIAWVGKTDSLGYKEWSYESDLPDESYFNGAAELPGKRFIVTGITDDKYDEPDNRENGFYFVFDSTGNVIHEEYFANTQLDERADDVMVIDSVSFLLLSFRFVYTPDGEDRGYADYYWELSKINTSNYEIIWKKEYHPLWGGLPRFLEKDDDGNFYIIGDAYGFYGEEISRAVDYWVIKVDSEGETVWKKRYGAKNNERIWQAEWHPEYQKLMLWGGIYLTHEGYYDSYLATIDTDGSIIDSTNIHINYKSVVSIANDTLFYQFQAVSDTDYVYINNYGEECLVYVEIMRAKSFSASNEELFYYDTDWWLEPQKIISLPNNEYLIIGYDTFSDSCDESSDYYIPEINKVRWSP